MSKPEGRGKATVFNHAAACWRASHQQFWLALSVTLGHICGAWGVLAILIHQCGVLSAGLTGCYGGRLLRSKRCSTINALLPGFSLPTGCALGEIPKALQTKRCLLALAAKLAYEEPSFMHHIACQAWGFSWVADSGASQGKRQAIWSAFGNSHATVLAFSCTWTILDLLSWTNSWSKNLTHHHQFGGVNDAVFGTLLAQQEVGGPAVCDQAAAVLRNRLAGKQQQVYVAGHGVGGALAAVFALYLHIKHPLLAANVKGISTFGLPGLCDDLFWEACKAAFGPRLESYMLEGDVAATLHFRPQSGGTATFSSQRSGPLPTQLCLSGHESQSLSWRQSLEEGPRRWLHSGLLSLLPGLVMHLPGSYVSALQGELYPKSLPPCMGSEADEKPASTMNKRVLSLAVDHSLWRGDSAKDYVSSVSTGLAEPAPLTAIKEPNDTDSPPQEDASCADEEQPFEEIVLRTASSPRLRRPWQVPAVPKLQQQLTPREENYTRRAHNGGEGDEEQLQDIHMQQQLISALSNPQRLPQTMGRDADSCRKSISRRRLQLFASSSSRLPAGPGLSGGDCDSGTHTCEAVSEPDNVTSNARGLTAKACALRGVKSKGASPGLKSGRDELTVPPDDSLWHDCENWAGLRSPSPQEMLLSVPD